MKIGFDLDNIFISTPPFVPKAFIDRLYKKKDNGNLLYRIPTIPEQFFRQSTHHPLFRPAITENLNFLRNIDNNENELYLISSRFKFLEKRTQQLIHNHNFDKIFDGMYFNYQNIQPHIFKNTVLTNLNLDLYVDDDLSLIKHVAKDNKSTKFFWLNSMKKEKPISDNIFQISTLSEMLKNKS